MAPPPGEAIDIDVATSQINLGVVQGFTPYVTNVTGTLQANVKVTGSGYDPHVDGAVDIKAGAFSIPDLGTSYSGLDTKIDLKPDLVTINEFRILDKNKQSMTIGGSLAVHERSVGAVDITVQSDDFKIAANKTADLKFDTDVHITGTIRAPKVEGSVEVEPGTIDVADVLRLASSRSAYSTTATEIAPEDSAGPQPTTPAVPGMAIIGRGSAICDLRGLRFSGPIAWLAWLFLHIFELIGFRNRLVVMIEWAAAYVTRQRSVRLITYQDADRR